MIRIATKKQAQLLDQEAQGRYSLQSRDLMNAAGAKACRVFQKLYPDKNKKIVVLCGPGNNGGDGIAMYRELMAAKYLQLSCFFSAEPKSPTVQQQVRMLSKNIPMIDEKTPLPKADIYVDALFGLGLHSNTSGEVQSCIQKINASRAAGLSKTVSLDMPSGVCAQTGNSLGVSVDADHTVTFGVYKLGQWIQEGPQKSGQLWCVDIGFPKELVREIANTHFVFTHKDFLKYLPKRSETSNKSNYGHLKVWAGSRGMWGAALLTAQASYRLGTGYVSVETDESCFTQLPEVLVEKKSPIDNKYTYAVGPGWDHSPAHEQRLKALSEHKITNVVLDAEALNILAQAKNKIPVGKSWILTPHAKEMSRLLQRADVKTIDEDRSHTVIEAAEKFHCTVLLKGFRTLVATRGKVFIIPSGNSALAKAGSGDVLTGMIASLRAQNLSATKATLVGAYLHGLMADLWIKKNHTSTLTPSDLLKGLPKILKCLTQPKPPPADVEL